MASSHVTPLADQSFCPRIGPNAYAGVPIGCLTGIELWKRRRMQQLCGGAPVANSPVRAVAIARARGGAVASWAAHITPALTQLAEAAQVPLWSLEDGFIRSFGLGTALVQPASILVDTRGVHYDPSRPSDLEHILATTDFPPANRARAGRLAEAIRGAGITKYNLSGRLPDLPRNRRIVLVVGQVDDDRSVLLGGAGRTIADVIARAPVGA